MKPFFFNIIKSAEKNVLSKYMKLVKRKEEADNFANDLFVSIVPNLGMNNIRHL